jgi:hypothetical protein
MTISRKKSLLPGAELMFQGSAEHRRGHTAFCLSETNIKNLEYFFRVSARILGQHDANGSHLILVKFSINAERCFNKDDADRF